MEIDDADKMEHSNAKRKKIVLMIKLLDENDCINAMVMDSQHDALRTQPLLFVY
jgi:hypothetical protein